MIYSGVTLIIVGIMGLIAFSMVAPASMVTGVLLVMNGAMNARSAEKRLAQQRETVYQSLS